MLNIDNLSLQIEGYAFVLLIVLAVIEIGMDLISRSQRDYQDTGANVAIAIGYAFASAIFSYAIALGGLEFFAGFALLSIPENIWTLILTVIIADFIYYWEHRIEHRIRFFWAYHNVHHSSTDYNYTVASRLSWVESCFLWVFYIPMALSGFNPLLIFIGVQISAAYQTWIHTEKIGKLGWLEKIINTPALHRVHHASNSRYIDRNFGGILIIWDRLFGTYQSEREKPVYGLTENINTTNPIEIQAIEYQRIAKYIMRSRSFKEVWQSIFGNLNYSPKSVTSKNY